MAVYGSVELGGTKTLVGSGTHPDHLAPISIPTTGPEETLAAVIDILRGVDAVGIASFGPLELQQGADGYGMVTTTPKPGWLGARVLEVIREGVGVPAGIDTDVNGAALGETRWGAGQGLHTVVYVTVGTGIGGGAVVDGSTLRPLGHPEMGHLVVRRMPGDDYPGRCPYHGDCLEGMASGPALADRYGPHGEWDEDAIRLASFYLAQGLRDIVYVLAPQRVIVGGGVSRMEGFHDGLQDALVQELAGYPGLSEHGAYFVVPPGLGGLSGLAGGLVLAESALA